MHSQTQSGYEVKFAEFIRMCAECQANGIQDVIVPSLETIGDTEEEFIESRIRLAAAGLRLHIAAPGN